MASLALRPRAFALPILAELLERQRTLARYGLVLLALSLVAVALQSVDPRTLESGVSVWVKPAKFLSSVGIFALTAAWLFGCVRPERRSSRPMRAVVFLIVVAGSFELAWIAWQGANGLESHFNNDTALYSVMYSLMGLFAVLLLGTTLPLAWEIGRRPASGLSRDFLPGGGLGAYIRPPPGHAVGAEGGHLPMFGWNRSGGDLRIAHFLGIHAEQAIPLLAFMVAGAAPRLRWSAVIGGTTLYVALTLAVFAQAIAGRPLLPL